MAFNSICVSGKQICDYIWVVNRPLNNNEEDFVSDRENEPNWSNDTELLVTFNHTLLAGNISDGSDVLTTWLVYRQMDGDTKYTLAGKLVNGEVEFIDYNITNKHTYTYMLTAGTAGYITTPITTAPVSVEWENWQLFSADSTDDPNQVFYHEGFIFGLDLKTGAMSNNIQSVVNQNFTSYPKIHKSKANYYSGTLGALLGYISCPNEEYVEPLSLETRLKAFTTDSRRKFLKDYRGHIWEVEITTGLSVTPRESMPDWPYDITVGWTEVAPVDELRIVGG